VARALNESALVRLGEAFFALANELHLTVQCERGVRSQGTGVRLHQ
jgi:hypothetical protein